MSNVADADFDPSSSNDRPKTRGAEPASERCGGETRSCDEPKDGRGSPAVRARNLTKTYGSGDEAVTAVDEIDIEIGGASAVGILGPNGAGKTTTIKLLLGLILPDATEARIDGTDVLASPQRGYRAVAAMLEGARNVYWRLTVRENVRYFARLADRPADPDRIDALIEQVGLAEKADVTVNERSRGMKQKTSLACTLVRDTPVVFLDEPTLGLDVESSLDLRRELRALVDEEDRTVIISSHDMDVIEAVCDRVVIMNDGRIVADDSIDGLRSLFRTQAYRVRLDGSLAAETKARLEAAVGATEWVERNGTPQFDARTVRGAEFHDMLSTIEASAAVFRSVDLLEPDLEEIFLAVTDDGESAESVESGGARTTDAGTSTGTDSGTPTATELGGSGR